MNDYRNKVTKKVAKYDPQMGLWYVDGDNFSDGPMIPLSKHELDNSDEWEELQNNDN